MIYYLHIPKTGGQTLGTRMAAAFPRDRSWVLQGDIRTPAQLKDLLERHDFVEGHAGIGALRGLDPAVDVVCTVREPVAHVRSLFAHILREPRLRLHKPAKALGFSGFARHYGDRLFNMQAMSLVQVFHGREIALHREGQLIWTLERLAAAVRRVRWLVPTEQIDDFCRWWPVENGRPPLPEDSRNATTHDAEDDEVAAYAQANPQHLGLDLTFWSLATERYAAWRAEVARRAVPPPGADHPTCGFADAQGRGIWLERNWYMRSVRHDGVAEWWAGPTNLSTVLVRRAPGQMRLSFEVPALIGIRHENIAFFVAGTDRRLPARVAPVGGGPVMELSVTLPSDLGEEFRLEIQVMWVGSLVEADPASGDGQRRSFASQSWSLQAAG